MYLGIDVGTGTLKAAVFDEAGGLVAAAEESYEAPPATAAGADFDPAVWWNVCRRVVRRVTASHGRSVTAAAIAGQMHGVVLVDAKGRPVRDAVLWPDQRAMAELEEFSRFDDQHPGVLGNPIVPGMAGPILAWLARHEQAALRATHRVVQPKDWLRMQLCRADPLTDPSDASATLLYDVGRDGWSEAVCAAVGIDDEILSRIVPSSAVAGAVDPSVAEELNLRSDVPVMVGCGDAAAALLGAGIEKRGTALVNTGTGAQVMTPIEAPASGRLLGSGIHQYRSASGTVRWYAMAAVANAGLALAWVRDVLGFTWDQMYATARSVVSSDSDPLFLPFFSGEREPSREATKGAAWSELRLSHDRDALARSAVRSVALYLGMRARALIDLEDVSAAIMSGGATRHLQWVELMATVLGLEVSVATDAHLTVRGAARLAARGVGSDLPDPAPGRTIEPRSGVDVEGPLEEFRAAIDRYFGA